MRKIDRSGLKYGRLIVVKESEKRSHRGDLYWECKCECGTVCTVGGSNLTSGRAKSCGCLSRELSSERAKRIFTKEKTPCSIPGCQENTSKGGNGMCGKHAQRYRRYGDAEYITPIDVSREHNRIAQLNRVESVKETTYRKYYGKHEHRVIAERIVGRKLGKFEHVHHIDENKHNNAPENLQVMTAKEHLALHAKKRNAT